MNLQQRYIGWLVGCIFFLFMALSLTNRGVGMFTDTDPLWHIAAGDWIREHGELPFSDPWSFTAGNYRWLNISWAWDTLFSWIHDTGGWHSAFAVNSLIVTLTLTIIYAHCLKRSGSIPGALLATLGVTTLFALHLRPLQMTNLLLAVWMLVLGMVMRGECRRRWLALLPVLAVVWVNVHGGFILVPVLIGAFFLQAVYERNEQLALQLLGTGAASFIGLLCNPYGFSIFEAAWRPLTTVANQFIIEWMPLSASPDMLMRHLYLIYFLVLVPQRKLPLLPAERILAYFWMVMALTSVRHMAIFAVIAAAPMACVFSSWFSGMKLPKALQPFGETVISVYGQRRVVIGGLAACVLAACWLPSHSAAQTYKQDNITPLSLHEELDYIQAHYPNIRLLNHFNLGSMILYETRGRIPLFVDPRTETAFPPQVLADYLALEKALPGWEAIFKTYAIDAILLPNSPAANGPKNAAETIENPLPDLSDDLVTARFRHNTNWKMVYQGPHAMLFVRRSLLKKEVQ